MNVMMSGEVTVWDSNVLIPLILPRSKSTALYTRFAAANWSVASTPSILEEVRAKLETKSSLRKWLSLTDEDIAKFVDNILPALVVLYPGNLSAAGAVPADADDDMVIAAALESHAKYLVTEDQDLLRLGNYSGVLILTRDMINVEMDRLGVS